MKYIRTEDGIYEDAGTDALGWRCVRYKGNKIALSQDDDEILKEANTIEELCDEFVAVSELEKKPYVTKGGYKGICEGFEYAKERGIKASFYGAIWTDKGLVYVAKMNEKGELELL